MKLNEFKVTFSLTDDRSWSNTQVDEAIEQLIDAGFDGDAMQQMFRDIVIHQIGRTDILVKVQEVY